MAIGDMRQSGRTVESAIFRFDAARRDDLVVLFGDIDALFREKLFRDATPRTGDGAVRRGWRETLKAWLHAKPQAWDLNSLLDAYTKPYEDPRRGARFVQIPHSHLLFVARASDCDALAQSERAIASSLDAQWKPFVDPALGTRVRFWPRAGIDQSDLTLWIGRGVFVPATDEATIGEVLIASLPASAVETVDTLAQRRVAGANLKWEPICLPGRRIAGVYRGQTALTFAQSQSIAPATVDWLESGASRIELTFSSGEQGSSTRLYPRVSMNVVATEHAAKDRFLDKEEAHLDTPCDGCFLITLDSRPHAVVRVVLDNRDSALLGRPDAADLAIVGVLAPRPAGYDRILRWWIDLDAREMLLSDNTGSPRKTIVFPSSGGSRGRLYDWSEARTSPAPSPLIRETRTFGAAQRDVLLSPQGKPFGYLRAPRPDATASLTPSTIPNVYSLDWLDFSGGVEAVNGDVTLLARALETDEVVAQLLVPNAGPPTDGEPYFLGPLLVRRIR